MMNLSFQNIYIVDDSSMDRKTLIDALNQIDASLSIHEFDHLSFPQQLRYPAIFFIDCQFDGCDDAGLRYAQQLAKLHHRISIVFISWHSQLVFDYFRFDHRFFFVRKQSLLSDLKVVFSTLNKQWLTLDQIINHDDPLLKSTRLDQLAYVSSRKNNIELGVDVNDTILLGSIKYRFKQLLADLKSYDAFVVINRGLIVNIYYLIDHFPMDRLRDQSFLDLSPTLKLTVSRNYIKWFNQRLIEVAHDYHDAL